VRCEQRNDQQREQRLKHHQYFRPPREHRRIGRREGRAGIEREKQIVNEIGGPILEPCLTESVLAESHLRKEESPLRMSRGLIPLVRSPGIQSPVPQGKHQNIGDPQRSGGVQQRVWCYFVRRQGID
jgi:hypothetical protein